MLLSLSLSLLAGCPTDAPVDVSPPPGAQGGPGGEGAPPMPGGEGAPPPGSDPGAGDPAAMPGGEGGAPAGEGGMPAAEGPRTLEVTPGTGVKLGGTVVYTGKTSGIVRMDLMDKDGKLLHATTIPKLGPWEIEVPKDLGEVRVSAFIDADANGPSSYDPTGEVKATVAQAPVSGLTITLVESTDAGGGSAGGAPASRPDLSMPDELGGKPPPAGTVPKKAAPEPSAPTTPAPG